MSFRCDRCGEAQPKRNEDGTVSGSGKPVRVTTQARTVAYDGFILRDGGRDRLGRALEPIPQICRRSAGWEIVQEQSWCQSCAGLAVNDPNYAHEFSVVDDGKTVLYDLRPGEVLQAFRSRGRSR